MKQIPTLKINIEEIKYGLNKVILKDILLTINKNGLYGIFGKNGGGKSTFFKALCGLKPYKGTVQFNDKILSPSEIAFIATEPQIYNYLTAKEFYHFYHKVSGRKKSNSNRIFEIDEKILLNKMSTGTLKKAYINTVLQFNDYEIYIFDEPFNGLDIESNYILLNKIRSLAQDNIVFVSSHVLEIVYPYLEKIFLIDDQTITEIKKENVTDLLITNKVNA